MCDHSLQHPHALLLIQWPHNGAVSVTMAALAPKVAGVIFVVVVVLLLHAAGIRLTIIPSTIMLCVESRGEIHKHL